MFTGIVSGIGKLVEVVASDSGAAITVELCSVDSTEFSSVLIGHSLCVSGVCLTVTSLIDKGYKFYVSKETLSCTCGLDIQGSFVNLEPSLKAASHIGGHFVFGHVDCVGKIVEWSSVGDSQKMVVSVPAEFAPYIARKGSIAVSGISLTVNEVVDSAEDVRFSINLIPYTLSHTIADHFQLLSLVNVEIDMMSRYVSRCAEVFLNKLRSNGV